MKFVILLLEKVKENAVEEFEENKNTDDFPSPFALKLNSKNHIFRCRRF